jgi:hypothetical protein
VDSFGSAVEFIGPFQHHDVLVHGWQVPLLEARPHLGGRLTLTLDQRFGLELSLEEAERIIPFIAECIAVALGFASHPSGEEEPKHLPRLRPRRMVDLDVTPELPS